METTNGDRGNLSTCFEHLHYRETAGTIPNVRWRLVTVTVEISQGALKIHFYVIFERHSKVIRNEQCLREP